MTHKPHPRSLQALILDKKGDRSYERVSRDCGGTPTRNALQKLATSRTRAFPDRDTLLGLQRGLPAAMPELLSACAISMGLLDDASAPGTLVLRGAGDLPTSAQKLLIDLSHEMQRLVREGDGDADAAPITHAGESPATDDELDRRRRARAATPPAFELIEGDGDTPVPDEHLMAGYDAPSEGRALREQQDADAEGPQE